MTPEEQSSVTKRLFIVGTVFALIGAGIVAIVNQIQAAASGDTPVILIGGSVDLNAKKNWQTDTTPGAYYAQGGGMIGTISIRNPKEDQVVNVKTEGQPWTVTVVSDQTDAVQVNQAAGDPNIHVAPLSGTLTKPTATTLHYHRSGMQCPGGGDSCDKLLNVTVTVNGIPLGIFNCTDSPVISGHCRVVFIEK